MKVTGGETWPWSADFQANNKRVKARKRSGRQVHRLRRPSAPSTLSCGKRNLGPGVTNPYLEKLVILPFYLLTLTLGMHLSLEEKRPIWLQRSEDTPS